MEKKSANIFEIQPFSIHDGPGIRTTVFLKGCPLHCLWCHNPESHRMMPESMYFVEKCTGCQQCVNVCEKKGLRWDGAKVIGNPMLCDGCGDCVQICPNNARKVVGKTMTSDKVLEQVLKDKMFYDTSGGGVTISGGEPLLFPEFVEELIIACRKAGVHTAVETSGYASENAVVTALKDVDMVLFDLKMMDSEIHKKLTGVENNVILENVVYIKKQLKKPMVIRVPVVTGCNDSEENMKATARFVKEHLGENVPIHLLPYHKLGVDKQIQLSKEEVHEFTIPEDSWMEHLKDIIADYGVCVQIGGSM